MGGGRGASSEGASGVEVVLVIEPDDVERIVHDDAMDPPMLVGGDAELPAGIVAETLVQRREAIGARGL